MEYGIWNMEYCLKVVPEGESCRGVAGTVQCGEVQWQ
jgi:hypothetical protein